MTPGDDVWVEIDGGCFPGEVVQCEHLSGFVTARIHTDPLWDFGRSSPHVMPEQIVAVRQAHVRPKESEAK